MRFISRAWHDEQLAFFGQKYTFIYYKCTIVLRDVFRNPFGVKNQPKRTIKTGPSEEAMQIGKRLLQIRFDFDISQLAASQELRISRAQLANYEEARTPLRFEVGLDACSKFIYSEKWLATGDGDPHQLMNLRDDPIVRKIKRGTAFGAAFREILAPRYDQLLSFDPDGIRLAPYDSSSRFGDPLGFFGGAWDLLLSEGQRAELSRRLIDLGNKFCAQNADESWFDFRPGSTLEECGSILAAKQIFKLKQKLKK